ncbi:EcsC family protein [Bacillus infantis]|uniref:EcsC family protein n=1 Tax=Bacillus infantis TaxID=324767 RepID=UPI001CD7CFB3|nr:EcsC family protein [Bacillus infantis]MCA1035707.1 EcsC family protein [Bacillus infantis]
MTGIPTPYEAIAIKEIHEWKSPSEHSLNKIMKLINLPFEKGYGLVNKIPGVEVAIEKSIGGIINLINEGAQWSVRSEAIYKEFRVKSHNVYKPEDIFMLDLNEVDKVLGRLSAKYKVIAGSEGAATGAVGLPGIPVDIVALLALNLRAIGEYATYYGFDINLQHERLFALNILGLVSSPTDASKQIMMNQLAKISKEVAKKKAWKVLEDHIFVNVVKKIADRLGQNLTKAKLGQIVPAAGAVVGGGFNVYFTDKVCEAAYYLYRERFLLEKYGGDTINVTLEPNS